MFGPGSGNEKFVLEKVFRQKDDQTFLNILNELREGVVSNRTVQIMTAKMMATNRQNNSSNNNQDLSNDEEIQATKLFSTNAEVDTFNATELNKLQHTERQRAVFDAIDKGSEKYLPQLRNGTKAPLRLELRIGAQVMLLKNLATSRGLVNGARGIVVAFEESNHRSDHYPLLPIVKFECTVGSNKNVETICVVDDVWEIKTGDSVMASRIQIPLMLAWAISIHKSQGMTIPKLEVDLNRIFEYGQGYVALSRATCLSGLTVHHFEPHRIKAHPLVKDFYSKLKKERNNDSDIINLTEDDIHNSGPFNSDGLVEATLQEFAEVYKKTIPPAPPVDEDEDGWMDTKHHSKVSHFDGDTTNSTVSKDEWLDGPNLYSRPSSSWISNQEPKPLVNLSTSSNNTFHAFSYDSNNSNGNKQNTPFMGFQSKSGSTNVALKKSPTPKSSNFHNQMTPNSQSNGPFSSFFSPYLNSSNRKDKADAKGPFSSDSVPNKLHSNNNIAKENVMTNETKLSNYYATPDSIPPELQRKIEANRQAALEKLKLTKLRSPNGWA